jgi:hypothetical protein
LSIICRCLIAARNSGKFTQADGFQPGSATTLNNNSRGVVLAVMAAFCAFRFSACIWALSEHRYSFRFNLFAVVHQFRQFPNSASPIATAFALWHSIWPSAFESRGRRIL